MRAFKEVGSSLPVCKAEGACDLGKNGVLNPVLKWKRNNAT